jgi:hypothetical protein
MMIKTIAIAMIGAACLTAPAFAQTPATKAQAPDCAALWKTAHGNAADKILTDKEAEKLKPVMSQVDANKDGKVSDTEFTAACHKGLMKDVKF